MKTEIENPKAFPITNDNLEMKYQGMYLRDYFAAKAMQGICSLCDKGKSFASIEEAYNEIAKHSYMIADEMLKERVKSND